MKQNKYILLSIFLVLILSSFSSCDKDKDEDFSVLPAETQSGNNTFGCYIKNEMYFGGYFPVFGANALEAEYDIIWNRVIIESFGQINKKDAGILYLEFSTPIIDSIQHFDIAYYLPSENFSTECFQYAVKNDGEICITKLDTINKIISGRFNFKGRCSDDLFNFTQNDSISISQGRFDLKMKISNK